ncbi:MAG: sulfotransferase [Phycisphaerales bacterium]
MQQQAQANQPTPQQVFEEGYRLLKMGDVHEAAKRAGKLRAHFPDDIPVLTFHGLVLAKLGIHAQALSDLIRAAQLTEKALINDEDENPSRPRIVDQLIRLCVQICRSSVEINEFQAANEAIENALKWDPDRGDAVAAKAELLAAQGQISEAMDLIKQAQRDKLDSYPIVLAKANVLLSAESASDEQLAEVKDELETESAVSGHGALELGDLLRALGAIEHRLGNFDEAFNAYRRAAKLRRGSYDPRPYTMMATKVIHDWNREAYTKLVRPEQSGESVVLVLGAPHSGVQELSAMLGQFEGASVIGPIETLSSTCVRHLNARQGVLRPVPFEPTKLRGKQLEEAGTTYRTQVGMMGKGAQRTIDTHPHNIPLAGAAAASMPGLNIILCRRDPMESTLATYCDAMVGNHPYASELINAAGFVADSNRMMDHWLEVLGDEAVGANVVTVEYNDLVKDPKKTAAKVAREIGLDARATSIKAVPSFNAGPETNTEAYASFTKAIEGFFDPAASA